MNLTLPDTLYLSHDVLTERVDEHNQIVISDRRTGKRLALSRLLYELLLSFEDGRSVKTLLEGQEDEIASQMYQALQKLCGCGFLSEASRNEEPPPPSPFSASVYTFLQAPRASIASLPHSVGIFGVPSDLGNVTLSGSRLAPDALRLSSQDGPPYSLDKRTLQPAGWYDVSTGCHVLKGLSLADWGNVRWMPGEDADCIHERIYDATREVLSAGAVPLVLGGDHSISYGVIRALQEEQPLVVIWIDAHTDLEEWHPWMGSHTHGSVATRVCNLPNVFSLFQVGQRGFITQPPSRENVRLKVLGARALLRMSEEELAEWLPKSKRCYISVDIDCLDPAFAPGTSTPVSDGLSPHNLVDLLTLIGNRNDVVGADVVEVNPTKDPSSRTVLAAKQLTTTLLATCFLKDAHSTEMEDFSHENNDDWSRHDVRRD